MPKFVNAEPRLNHGAYEIHVMNSLQEYINVTMFRNVGLYVREGFI